MDFQKLATILTEEELRDLIEEIKYKVRSSHLSDDEVIDPDTEERTLQVLVTLIKDAIFDNNQQQSPMSEAKKVINRKFEDRLDEREDIISFLRYLQRKTRDNHTEELLEKIQEDIQDEVHKDPAYQL